MNRPDVPKYLTPEYIDRYLSKSKMAAVYMLLAWYATFFALIMWANSR